MKPTKDLFDLIHSFSPAEHKLFVQQAKRYAEEKDQKKYQRLYEAIRQQDSYDEEALKTQLQDVIAPQNFASWKRHLTEKLEDVMREAHAGEDDHTRMQELLRHAELYMRRGMWSRARKLLGECKQLAARQDALPLLLQINEQERRLVLEFQRKGLQARIEVLSAEWYRLTAKLHDEQAYVLAFDQVGALMRSAFRLSQEQITQIVLPLLASPPFSPDAAPPTFRARRMHHQGRAYLLHLSQQPDDEYAEYQRLLQLWETHPAQQRSHPRIYKLALANSLHSAAKVDRWDDFPPTLDLMAAIPPSNRNEEADDFQTIGLMRLLYHYNTHRWEEALLFFPNIEAGLVHYQAKVNLARLLAFRVNMLLIFFLTEDLSHAQTQMNNILDLPPTDHRTDLQALARIWEPVLLIERKDAELAATRLHALREWLRSNKLLLPFERLVSTHLQALSDADPEMLPTTFQTFAQALQAHRASHGHANGLDELLIWAESRARGITMPAWLLKRRQPDA